MSDQVITVRCAIFFGGRQTTSLLKRAGCGAHSRRVICGYPSSPVTGAHSRGDPPCYGRCQNEARGNNDRNPEAGVSIQRGPCQHENDARPEQNAICHQIDQRGDLCACRGFPCHRQPFRFHLSVANGNSPAAQWFPGRTATSDHLAKGTEWENKPVEEIVKGTFGENQPLFNKCCPAL